MPDNLIKFLAEIYMLKRNTREGWRVAGVVPDSLADHVAICAQLAYLLGELEGLSGERCAAIALFHDNGEARIGDHHKIAKRYLDKTDGELAALTDQLQALPDSLARKIGALVRQHEHADTPEGRVAKDADTLEFALQAKIHAENGNVQAQRMFTRQAEYFKTKAGKDIYDRVAAMDDFSNCWNWELLNN